MPNLTDNNKDYKLFSKKMNSSKVKVIRVTKKLYIAISVQTKVNY